MARVAPYTPRDMKEIAGQLGRAYGQGEKQILGILAKGNISDWKQAFLRQQLTQIAAVQERLHQDAVSWADLHIPNLYGHGVTVVQTTLPGGMDLGMTRLHQTAIAHIADSIVRDLDHATGGVGRVVRDVYRRATMEGIQQGLIGGETRKQVSNRIIDTLTEKGITSFTDKSGRQWDLESYAEMAARSTVREAQSLGTQNAMLEAGEDLVIISTHDGSCELCQPWEGVVVSITGNTDGYPTLQDAIDEGYGHPNCAHTEEPFIEDMTALDEAAAAGE